MYLDKKHKGRRQSKDGGTKLGNIECKRHYQFMPNYSSHDKEVGQSLSVISTRCLLALSEKASRGFYATDSRSVIKDSIFSKLSYHYMF